MKMLSNERSHQRRWIVRAGALIAAGMIAGGPSEIRHGADSEGSTDGGDRRAARRGSSAHAAPAAQGAAGRFGIAHIDVMERHIERTPAGPRLKTGVTEADTARRYARAVETGASWHRTSFYWDLVESDGFKWDVVDSIVARDSANGLRTLAVLQGHAPGSVVPGVPPGLDVPIFRTADGGTTDDPAAASAVNTDNPWARFVDEVVGRYMPGGTGPGSGVRAWEIGNEPNLAHFWAGSPEDFARYLEVAYLVIERRDPGATVLHGGLADDAGAGNWFARFLTALQARAANSPLPARYGYYFDATAWHWYTVPSRLHNPPSTAAALLARHGIPAKPLWVTEFGVPVWSEYPGPCWDASSPLRVSAVEQAAFVWQSIAEGLAAGAERMIWFQLQDDCGNGPQSYDAFGLLRNPLGEACWAATAQGCWREEPALAGQPRAAFDAFKIAVRELSGARAVRPTAASQGWSAATFARGGERVTFVWSTSRGGAQARLPASSGSGALWTLDLAGVATRTTAQASGGAHSITLSGVTNRNRPGGNPMVDGRPVILIESGSAGAGLVGPGPGPVPGPGGSFSAPAVAPVGAPAAAPGAASAAGVAPRTVVDTTPPLLAVVEPLPAVSQPVISLSVLSGDNEGGSGLGSFRIFYAADLPPKGGQGWTPIGQERAWPGSPRVGRISTPFVGAPGHLYYFAAQSADVAGNWTPLPHSAQAWTRIAGAGPGPSAPPSRWSIGRGYR